MSVMTVSKKIGKIEEKLIDFCVWFTGKWIKFLKRLSKKKKEQWQSGD